MKQPINGPSLDAVAAAAAGAYAAALRQYGDLADAATGADGAPIPPEAWVALHKQAVIARNEAGRVEGLIRDMWWSEERERWF